MSEQALREALASAIRCYKDILEEPNGWCANTRLKAEEHAAVVKWEAALAASEPRQGLSFDKGLETAYRIGERFPGFFLDYPARDYEEIARIKGRRQMVGRTRARILRRNSSSIVGRSYCAIRGHLAPHPDSGNEGGEMSETDKAETLESVLDEWRENQSYYLIGVNAVSRLASIAARLREALDALYSDNHQWSTRPCPTCAAITEVVGFPFGCNKKAILGRKE